MWGAIAKIGGTILAGLGVEWAVNSYTENKQLTEQQQKNIQIGKIIVGVAAIYLGFILLKKLK